MTRHPLAWIVVVAAVAGALAAAALAFALPESGSGAGARSEAQTSAPASVPSDDPVRPAIGRPRRDVRGLGQGWMRALGPARVEARAPDPRGGPPWAVRIVQTQRLSERRDGTLFPIGRPQWCAQLGRELDGRFGWIDAANRFRRSVGIVYRSNPMLCAPLRADLGREPQLELLTRVSDPSDGEPRPLQSVAWGFAGADGTLELRIDGRRRSVPATPHGAVLLALPASERRPQMQARARYPRGRAVAIDDTFRGQGALTTTRLREALRRASRWWRGDPSRGAADPLPRAGADPVLDYRIADPSTGRSLGIVAARTRSGGWCASRLAQVVGARVGTIDRGLGTFRDAGPALGRGCGSARRMSPARPLSLGMDFGGFATGPGRTSAAERRQRILRRTLPGVTSVSGVAHPDVRSITIATPRDVRTIVPSPRAHVFAVVYDGGFPTGEIAISARMRDGTVHRERPWRGF